MTGAGGDAKPRHSASGRERPASPLDRSRVVNFLSIRSPFPFRGRAYTEATSNGMGETGLRPLQGSRDRTRPQSAPPGQSSDMLRLSGPDIGLPVRPSIEEADGQATCCPSAGGTPLSTSLEGWQGAEHHHHMGGRPARQGDLRGKGPRGGSVGCETRSH